MRSFPYTFWSSQPTFWVHASKLAEIPAPVGTRVLVTSDTSGGPFGTEYMLMRAPSTRAHHWKPVYNGAAHMLFSARPDARDVPYGTVIAGTDILNARFVAQTKNGITDWYPEGGEQVIGKWQGEAQLFVANSTGGVVVPSAMLIPAGVAGLYGGLTLRMVAGQVYNTTGSGTPSFWMFGRIRRDGNTTTWTIPLFNSPFGMGSVVPSSIPVSNKKHATHEGGFSMLGDVMLNCSNIMVAGNVAGYQATFGYLSMESNFELDLYSAANGANISGKLVAAELTVSG